MSENDPQTLNLDLLYEVLESSPTVEAGLITVLVEVRHVIERIGGAYPDITDLRLFAEQLNQECAKIADAVMANTPAQGLR